jgi:hypothetical protein
MPAEDYPSDAFVTVTLELPLHGRIMVREEGSRRARVLWECQHDHATGEEAAACAGREIGRRRAGVAPPPGPAGLSRAGPMAVRRGLLGRHGVVVRRPLVDLPD